MFSNGIGQVGAARRAEVAAAADQIGRELARLKRAATIRAGGHCMVPAGSEQQSALGRRQHVASLPFTPLVSRRAF